MKSYNFYSDVATAGQKMEQLPHTESIDTGWEINEEYLVIGRDTAPNTHVSVYKPPIAGFKQQSVRDSCDWLEVIPMYSIKLMLL